MGLNGSVVIYPDGGRAPGRKRLAAAARDIVRAFERAALLPVGTADSAPVAPTADVVGCAGAPSEVAGVMILVQGDSFLPRIADLIFTMTYGEAYRPLPKGVTADQLALPILTVSVSSQAVRAIDLDAKLVCRSWAMVEFSFEDVRVNLEEVHRIRDEGHPLYHELASTLKTRVTWSVVMD